MRPLEPEVVSAQLGTSGMYHATVLGKSLCFIPIRGPFGGFSCPFEPEGFLGKSIG